MTLKRKLEVAITAYLKTLTASILDGYHFYESSIANKRELPGFVIRASGESEVWPGGSPRNVKLEIVAMTQLDDNEEGEVPDDDTRARVRENHDEALAAVESALEAPGTPATMRTMFNSGGTNRPVTDFHFYDLTKSDEQPMGGDGRHYADGLDFEVVCQNCDG